MDLEEAKKLLKQGYFIETSDEGKPDSINGHEIDFETSVKLTEWMAELLEHYKYRVDLGEEVLFYLHVGSTDFNCNSKGYVGARPGRRILSINDVLVPYTIASDLVAYIVKAHESDRGYEKSLLESTKKDLERSSAFSECKARLRYEIKQMTENRTQEQNDEEFYRDFFKLLEENNSCIANTN